MPHDRSIQNLLGSWWIEDKTKTLKPGRLIKAFVPHVDQIPLELNLLGRSEPTNHTKARYEISPLRINQPPKKDTLPVAGVPLQDNEKLTAYKSKKRPMLVLAEGFEVPEEYRRGDHPKWQTSPTIIAAPYYGVKQNEKRKGFIPEFVDRVRAGEYPHYLWDELPMDKGEESLLRLDHLQPIGKHHQSIEICDFRLCEDALIILDEYLNWFLKGNLDSKTLLADLRKVLMQSE